MADRPHSPDRADRPAWPERTDRPAWPEGRETRKHRTYAESGVDIEAGEKAVHLIAEAVRSTHRREVVGGIGGFGGLFALDTDRYTEPLLVASTDGVGTKAAVAAAAGRYETIGIDLVAMLADDIVCSGAEPLFLLDYLAVGKLEPDTAAAIVGGVADGCRQAGCALLGGEMAEHPGAMDAGEFDLSGTVVGVVERSHALGPDRVRPGDRLVGLASPGLRCNGYSLARQVLLADRGLDDPAWPGARRTAGQVLLEPSIVYTPAVLAVARALGPGLRAAAHITGGGIVGNLPRVLPSGTAAWLEWGRWGVPAVFAEMRKAGPVEPAEMARVFNLGLGMVLVVAEGDSSRAVATAEAAGVPASVVGEVMAGAGVEIRGLEEL